MRTRLAQLSLQELTGVVLLVAVLLLAPPLLYWWAHPASPWFLPYLLWGLIIALAALLQQAGRRDV